MVIKHLFQILADFDQYNRFTLKRIMHEIIMELSQLNFLLKSMPSSVSSVAIGHYMYLSNDLGSV